ncbi:MAG: hypothetical protein H6964_16540 [Chromatiaceae bacterium]|nr:hypothetical protein [Gammaproteobacteria bacterium]MCB1861479.1 hypothetical protein [Gammaproteobacteria bacterium]MCB1873427.1 hypothetical protein [Gammaproteobacteria bacterium]MCB1879250.1 hypothetical protein [Gammaproteobacteria bacterium]MCP5448585.1 hypothetical protein [Chromatiaceae bacterium]
MTDDSASRYAHLSATKGGSKGVKKPTKKQAGTAGACRKVNRHSLIIEIIFPVPKNETTELA